MEMLWWNPNPSMLTLQLIIEHQRRLSSWYLLHTLIWPHLSPVNAVDKRAAAALASCTVRHSKTGVIVSTSWVFNPCIGIDIVQFLQKLQWPVAKSYFLIIFFRLSIVIAYTSIFQVSQKKLMRKLNRRLFKFAGKTSLFLNVRCRLKHKKCGQLT